MGSGKGFLGTQERKVPKKVGAPLEANFSPTSLAKEGRYLSGRIDEGL